jgi:predicted DsbA family dithiol-disulfide isomerase
MYREQAPDEEEPAVRWLPFQLNPDLPEEGISRQEYVERKFGPGGARNYSRVAGVGKEVGIDFAFDAIKVQPNTVNAHRLMLYGAKHGREDEVAESLFRAYFLEGANLTDKDALAGIGKRAGLDRAALAAYLASDDDRETVLRADIDARQAGINGVPFFIFNRQTAVSGAHEPETLLKAMLDARKI